MFKLLISLAALTLLTGCGFKPIYGSAGASNVGTKLSTIKVALIQDRIGQQLRNLLLDRINPGGTPRQPNYQLSVQIAQTKHELAVKKSEISTRANLVFTANFQLQGLGRFSDRSFSGNSKIVTSYNILSSNFGTLVAEKDARRRAVRELSDGIINRLAAYLQTIE